MTERFTHLKSLGLKMNFLQLYNVIHRKKKNTVYAYLFIHFGNYLLSVYLEFCEELIRHIKCLEIVMQRKETNI